MQTPDLVVIRAYLLIIVPAPCQPRPSFDSTAFSPTTPAPPQSSQHLCHALVMHVHATVSP
jgi:hypothetical protein